MLLLQQPHAIVTGLAIQIFSLTVSDHSAVFGAECSPGQAATSANECNIDITDGTRYFVCLSGVAAGGCRTQSQGTFGSACTRSCVIY